MESLLDTLTLGQLVMVNIKLKKINTLSNHGYTSEAARRREIIYFAQVSVRG